MATISQIIADKDKLLDTIPIRFHSRIERVERQLFTELIALLNELETKAGAFILTESNLLQINIIAEKLKQSLFQSDYVKAVTEFVKGFDTQAGLTNEYILKTFGSFEQSSLALAVLKKSKKDSIALLMGAPIDSQFIAPVRELLSQAIEAQSTFLETTQSVRVLLEGKPGELGRLRSYAGQVSWDSIAFADRRYTLQHSEDLGSEWFFYSGGILKDSRKFCRERRDKYFHKKEVQQWGNPELPPKDWQGRVKGTNSSTIFIALGGHNCKHSILPASVFSVPKKVILRNVKKGFFEPGQKEKELLKI